MDKDKGFPKIPTVTDSFISPHSENSPKPPKNVKIDYFKYIVAFVPITAIMIGVMINTYIVKQNQDIRSKAAGSCATKSKGDANCDSVINSTDLEIWKNEFTLKSKEKTSDFNWDNNVNLDDYQILISNLPNDQSLLSCTETCKAACSLNEIQIPGTCNNSEKTKCCSARGVQ